MLLKINIDKDLRENLGGGNFATDPNWRRCQSTPTLSPPRQRETLQAVQQDGPHSGHQPCVQGSPLGLFTSAVIHWTRSRLTVTGQGCQTRRPQSQRGSWMQSCPALSPRPRAGHTTRQHPRARQPGISTECGSAES